MVCQLTEGVTYINMPIVFIISDIEYWVLDGRRRLERSSISWGIVFYSIRY